jgi:hypothetical protein
MVNFTNTLNLLTRNGMDHYNFNLKFRIPTSFEVFDYDWREGSLQVHDNRDTCQFTDKCQYSNLNTVY